MIRVGFHYPVPLHTQPALSDLGYKSGDMPVAERLAARVLSLPMYPELKDEEVSYVCETVELGLKNTVREATSGGGTGASV